MKELKEQIADNLPYSIGLPLSAISAYAIVTALLMLFPATKTTTASGADVITLKAFSLEFSGPAAPITLWLACFIAFVGALKLLERDNTASTARVTKNELALDHGADETAWATTPVANDRLSTTFTGRETTR